MRDGEIIREEGLAELRARADATLRALPPEMRPAGGGDAPTPYPVETSASLSAER
jgi:hypothetical protein